MKKLIFAAMLASVAITGTAYAGMGIPNLAAQPVVAQHTPTIIGQAMPAFGASTTPVAPAQFAQGVVGETMAALVPVRAHQAHMVASITPKRNICGA
jgi:hypothetical protein